MKNRLVVTIDVEALPHRSVGDPIDQLIWGRHAGGEFGIDRMMDIADSHGVRLTMFLDYAEIGLYGTELLNVGRHIHSRGHDLQLHLHQQFLPEDFYISRGTRPVRDLNKADADQSRALVDFLCEQHFAVSGEAPVAFRGGGYRFSFPLLRELTSRRIFDSSVNVSRATQPVRLPPKAQFQWENGPLEIPISVVYDFFNKKRNYDYNFNAGAMIIQQTGRFLSLHSQFLDMFYANFGDSAIAVLVMHSWSFLALDAAGQFSITKADNMERFDALLAMLKKRLRFVDSRGVAEAHLNGGLGNLQTVTFDPTNNGITS